MNQQCIFIQLIPRHQSTSHAFSTHDNNPGLQVNIIISTVLSAQWLPKSTEDFSIPTLKVGVGTGFPNPSHDFLTRRVMLRLVQQFRHSEVRGGSTLLPFWSEEQLKPFQAKQNHSLSLPRVQALNLKPELILWVGVGGRELWAARKTVTPPSLVYFETNPSGLWSLGQKIGEDSTQGLHLHDPHNEVSVQGQTLAPVQRGKFFGICSEDEPVLIESPVYLLTGTGNQFICFEN